MSKISQQYAKEIDMLNAQLKEANQTIEADTRNRIKMQENLKKAFMRGVCALNIEAMNALNPGCATMDLFGMDAGMAVEQMAGGGDMAVPNMPSASVSQTPKGVSATSESAAMMGMISEPKIESKDHMWKPAPILSKEFTSNPPTVYPTMAAVMSTKIDGKSAMVLERNKGEGEAIGVAGEHEIRCERIQTDADMIEGIDSSNPEGVEARSFTQTKQPIAVQQISEISQSQPEGKVIRVNKYGKSYAANSIHPEPVSNSKPKAGATASFNSKAATIKKAPAHTKK